jgi:MoaA/NifB/PqqE/SkfB family radical SAM enzyme
MASKEEFIPKWIAWESTQRCNLNCVHCRCSSDMDAAVGDFSTEEATLPLFLRYGCGCWRF